MKVGVLALQGDFREHIGLLERLDVGAVEVRTSDDLAAVDALIIPGGESTTIGRLAEIYELMTPLRSRIASGMPTLGTCAGMIFLASASTDGDQPQLAVLDVVVERNAFGRQVDSFETDLTVTGMKEPLHAVFIRAPWIHKTAADVDVLAVVMDDRTGVERPVFVKQGNILATSFHPELIGETRIHAMLLDMTSNT